MSCCQLDLRTCVNRNSPQTPHSRRKSEGWISQWRWRHMYKAQQCSPRDRAQIATPPRGCSKSSDTWQRSCCNRNIPWDKALCTSEKPERNHRRTRNSKNYVHQSFFEYLCNIPVCNISKVQLYITLVFFCISLFEVNLILRWKFWCEHKNHFGEKFHA